MRRFVVTGLCVFGLALHSSSAGAQSQYLICIDPGHGGNDPGAVGCGLEEDAVNLDTSLRLRSLLQAAGFQVVMTRETDTTLSLTQRSDYANSKGATRFVAIHSNAGGGTGIETYCHTSATSTSDGYKLAGSIQDEMVKAWSPLPNRKLKQADFHVLRETNMAATLTELAFIDRCTPDATYLGSGPHREEAAVAHLRALQAHFGLPIGPVDPKGTARGVIFEDKGVGTADMTTRLEGATVTVVQTGAKATTEATTGNWSFELPVGTYTLKASKAGYTDGERSCEVKDGQTAWCSFGLLKVTQKGTAKGIVYVDRKDASREPLPGASITVKETGASATAQAGTAAFSFELDPGTYTLEGAAAGHQAGSRSCVVTAGQETDCAFGLAPNEPEPGPDAGAPGPDAAAQPGPDAAQLAGPDAATMAPSDAGAASSADASSTPKPPEQSGCGGCGAGGAGPVGLFGIVLALLAFAPRRRGAVAALAGLVALGGCEEVRESRIQSQLSERPVSVERTWKVAEGEWTAPVVSPSGDVVLFTRPGHLGLRLAPVSGGRAETLTEAEGAGYAPRFSADGSRIAFRVPGQPFEATPLHAIDRAGRVVKPFAAHDGLWALQRDDSIVLRRGRSEQVIAQAGPDRFFAPFLTPDARHVVYAGLSSGVYAYRLADGVTLAFGEGSHASVSEDGRWLVFTRTQDDGHVATAAELRIADLPADRPVTRRIPLPDAVALHPSLHGGTGVVVYATPEGIRAAKLVLK